MEEQEEKKIKDEFGGNNLTDKIKYCSGKKNKNQILYKVSKRFTLVPWSLGQNRPLIFLSSLGSIKRGGGGGQPLALKELKGVYLW